MLLSGERKKIQLLCAKVYGNMCRNREQYDRLTAELEDLHKKKKAIQNDEILKAIAESEKSNEKAPGIQRRC